MSRDGFALLSSAFAAILLVAGHVAEIGAEQMVVTPRRKQLRRLAGLGQPLTTWIIQRQAEHFADAQQHADIQEKRERVMFARAAISPRAQLARPARVARVVLLEMLGETH